MTKSYPLALCSAQPIALPADGVPEWLHLIPAGRVMRTKDGRGPYRMEDAHAVIAASFDGTDKLVLDVNHATDLAAPRGEEAPARGWIKELQPRQDGIWGRVEWNEPGRKMMENREYCGVSPVIAYREDGTIVAIRRASLTNQPNLQGLTALHQEDHAMDLKKMLIEALGLGEDADDAAIVAAVKKALGGENSSEKIAEAVQSVLTPIAAELGLAAGADAAGVLAGVVSLKAAGDPNDKVIVALQSELNTATTKLAAIEEKDKRRDAEAYVDGAIRDGRIGLKPVRDEYVAMHMENPARAEKLISAMTLMPGALPSGERQGIKKGAEIDGSDRTVIALMGLDPEAFKKTRAAEAGESQEAL